MICEHADLATAPNLPRVWDVGRRLLYRRAARAVTLTADSATWLRRRCSVPTTVLHNAVPPVVANAGRERIKQVLCVSRLDAHKGIEDLLVAFGTVCQQRQDWRLLILGDGQRRPTLEALAQELQIASRTEFAGSSAEVEGYMARAGMLVHPSHSEGFGMAILEGMAHGMAVIAADGGSGPRVLIQDGINGRLFPPGDSSTLAQTMLALMASESERAESGKAASIAAARFNEDDIMAKWRALLRTTQA